MWGYECFFSSFSSNSRGVAILINNNFEFKALRVKQDINGNYIIIEAMIEGHNVTLCNIYAPNDDKPVFFESLFETIDDFTCEHFILCGDFNLVFNPDLDYYNYINMNNPNARNKLL